MNRIECIGAHQAIPWGLFDVNQHCTRAQLVTTCTHKLSAGARLAASTFGLNPGLSGPPPAQLSVRGRGSGADANILPADALSNIADSDSPE